MADNHVVGIPITSSMGQDTHAVGGILTKAVISSPVVRWILHARVRRRRYNDVVFVGDDFIHVKQVKGHGPLEHIATKSDFDARIRAAKTFSNTAEDADEDLFVKVEDDEEGLEDANVPPQCLVLSLDSNDLIFVYLASDGLGGHRFVQQACPMPKFDRILFQLGEHLAVDPHSRALAVAANEREVMAYSAKPKEHIKHELQNNDQNWGPVSTERPLQVEGAVLHMDFLIPPSKDDGTDDGDHIILLLIVAGERRIRAILVDWYYTSDVHHAQLHPAQTLDVTSGVPSLLIPLRNAAFLLVNGCEIKRFNNILSGSATSTTFSPLDVAASYPGASPRRPVWANWCRPRRGQAAKRDTDHLYLVREDGVVYLMQATRDMVESHNAGNFGLPCWQRLRLPW